LQQTNKKQEHEMPFPLLYILLSYETMIRHLASVAKSQTEKKTECTSRHSRS